jgi:hypothetical protein
MHFAQIDEGQAGRDVDDGEIGLGKGLYGARKLGRVAGGGNFEAASGQRMFESAQQNRLLANEKNFRHFDPSR